MSKANLEIFSETLQAIAETDKDLYVVTSDSRGSGKLVQFGQKFPNQIVEVGIAEQNLVGVATGLAAMEKKAFAVSPACFLTARALEQIKNDVCYSDNSVKLIGISAGVSYGALGTTHHSLHDFAVLRAINNIIIVAPADNYETEEAIREATALNKPVYIRFGKKNMPSKLSSNQEYRSLSEVEGSRDKFSFGKGRVVREGSDLTFIATGETVLPAFEAAEKLAKENGIEATVVSMHTIKPLDTELITNLAQNRSPIITVEEHSIYGGLGEAVGSFLMQNGFRNKFKIVGLPDEHTVSGSQTEIFEHYGISKDGLAEMALKI
ncbi:Transketolase domain-containing protein [Emticicia oligotrophica DSM 17448]|uniref:Transketolase domain-containing protein n=1 Tax=Emticicia oligotrophica (strain DSM 17448 / CIP 109782 / MTCC 6937 / GPTSA100-15) TaxID=929562 RepID=A0ABN4AC36_EMTOG|nr:transketolase C-terminal domain-containing protein [Emticicia oligotrophica]AFK01752.1 Transketolase domain-containing protein [Emticicia oligotrophica DSM 17448]